MKKKILSLVLCLMICLSVFAGCSLVTRNDQKYYEAIVCTIDYVDGSKEKITKRDLLMGFNSYGYNYVQNYGYTQEQAVTTTLETIINQRLTIKAVENYYDNLNSGLQVTDEKYQPILNGSETTYLYDTTYSAIYGNLKSYFTDIADISYGEEEKESSNASVFSPYQRKAELEEVVTILKDKDGNVLKDENGNPQKKVEYVIKKTTTATTIRDTYEERKLNDEVYDFDSTTFKDLMYNKILSLTVGNDTSAKNWKSAFSKYISDIKKNYSYKKFANDKECFIFEMNRVYDILKDNYKVEKYETIFNKAEYRDDDLANVTVSDVLKYYSSKVRVDYADYVINGNVSGFESNILSDVANVDYILQGNEIGNYFYVGFVKLEFDDAQKARFDSIDNDAYLTEKQKEAEKESIYGSVMASVRDEKTGEITGKITSQQLLDMIKEDVNSTGKYTGDAVADRMTGYDKAEAFRKYLYLYNDDDTLKGAEHNTVFGVKNNGEVLANSTFSGKEEVTKAIKALYNEGNAKVGDTTDLVKGDDGLYIFFYAGKIDNMFLGIDENFDVSIREENVKVLASTRLNVFSEKTVFDSIYETLTTDNFSVFQNMNMQYLRSSLVKKDGIKSIKNNLKDLY